MRAPSKLLISLVVVGWLVAADQLPAQQAKRPITVDLLRRLDLHALGAACAADAPGIEKFGPGRARRLFPPPL